MWHTAAVCWCSVAPAGQTGTGLAAGHTWGEDPERSLCLGGFCGEREVRDVPSSEDGAADGAAAAVPGPARRVPGHAGQAAPLLHWWVPCVPTDFGGPAQADEAIQAGRVRWFHAAWPLAGC